MRHKPAWVVYFTRPEDEFDRARRARMTSGLGLILLVAYVVDVAVGILVHGVSVITLILLVGLVVVMGVWWLGRHGFATAAAVLLGLTIATVSIASAVVASGVSTWPVAVPITVLILVFMLPLRWAPALVLLGGAQLALMGALARGFDHLWISTGELLRDVFIATAVSVVVGLYGAFSVARADAERRSAVVDAGAAESRARHDPLTGLPNRRAETEQLTRDADLMRRAGDLLSVAMIDVDGFKAVNDRLGHEAGDKVLQAIAALISDESRRADTVVRHGGDEFLLAMPRAGRTEGARLCERVRESVSIRDWSDVTQSRVDAPTISVGVADTDEADDWADLVAIADRRLRAAKATGRDRVVSWD